MTQSTSGISRPLAALNNYKNKRAYTSVHSRMAEGDDVNFSYTISRLFGSILPWRDEMENLFRRGVFGNAEFKIL